MLIDKNLEIADDVSCAVAAGTSVLGTIDLGAADSKPNSGRNLFMYLVVGTTFTSGGAATVQFRLMSDTVTPIVPGNAIEHWESQAFAYTELTAGKRIVVPLPGGYPTYKRYLGLVLIVAVATVTAGKISAGLELAGENWEAFPDGI
jgi:hypothetical protein